MVNTIVYANIYNDKSDQQEIREARFVELYARFYDMRWEGLNLEDNPILSCLVDYSFKIEVAGIGIVSRYDLQRMKGRLYASESDACQQTHAIWQYDFDVLHLNFMSIRLKDLNVRNDKFTLFDNPDYSFKKLYAESWYWDGTKPTHIVPLSKFQYDFVGGRYVEFKGSDFDNNRKLYATKAMCEADNKPTIIRLNNKPRQVEKIVTFEITTAVKVNVSEMPECEEEDAITKAMDAIRACDDEVLFDACVSCTDMPSRE